MIVVLLVALAIGIVVTIFVLGFVFGEVDRGAYGRRWHELAAEDAADPALRRCAAVKAAHAAGEFGPEELDWRILLALLPPDPAPREIIDGPVGHWPHGRPTHTATWTAAAPARQFPRPQMEEIGRSGVPVKADPRLVDHREW